MTDKPKAFSVDHQVKQARDVKRLTKEVQRLSAKLAAANRDRDEDSWKMLMLAKLASDKAGFFNPFNAAMARKIRDQILTEASATDDREEASK